MLHADAEIQNRVLPTPILSFADPPSFQDVAISMAPHNGAIAQGSRISDRQQAAWNAVKTFTEPVSLERDLPPICLAQLGLSTATGVPK